MLPPAFARKLLLGAGAGAGGFFRDTRFDWQSRYWRQSGSIPAWESFHTSSLTEAARRPKEVEVLDLNASPQLQCNNLLCEKVGEPCICRISVVLEKLTNLKVLNLANNRLVSLPPSIWDLKALEELDLSGNLLESLPEGIKELPKLRRLNLDGNPIPASSLRDSSLPDQAV